MFFCLACVSSAGVDVYQVCVMCRWSSNAGFVLCLFAFFWGGEGGKGALRVCWFLLRLSVDGCLLTCVVSRVTVLVCGRVGVCGACGVWSVTPAMVETTVPIFDV